MEFIYFENVGILATRNKRSEGINALQNIRNIHTGIDFLILRCPGGYESAYSGQHRRHGFIFFGSVHAHDAIRQTVLSAEQTQLHIGNHEQAQSRGFHAPKQETQGIAPESSTQRKNELRHIPNTGGQHCEPLVHFPLRRNHGGDGFAVESLVSVRHPRFSRFSNRLRVPVHNNHVECRQRHIYGGRDIHFYG